MAENMEKIFRDPVCGMSTEDKDTFIGYDYKKDTYFFCSDVCLAKFKHNPESYAKGEMRNRHHSDQEAKTDTDRTTGEQDNEDVGDQKFHSQIYTCPMHPEVEQEGPGTCPKCAMATILPW